ncbi:glycoside hydrolase family 97 catalytic domain-containing protein [Amycolatopsis sp. NPDC049691]|uniref:glycoside hydrolase family 97 protein n=1 Tax=Amycolatopsis sp. NPDC049691 TaxID=3155155 RepID=UPI00344AA0B5
MLGEASAFTLPPAAPAWLLPYSPDYEGVRVETTAGDAQAGDYGFPSLFATGDGYTLLTESDVDGRYSGARLTHPAGSAGYAIKLADAAVTGPGPFATPWRVAITGDLAAVTESTLADDLARPSELDDTSWVRPGKVAWSWLSEHDSPGDPLRQKQFADFAARHGWPYLLVDDIAGHRRAGADDRLPRRDRPARVPAHLAHVLSFEADRGAEQLRTRAATNMMFPFTRNVVGSMDYTPTAFVVSDRDTTDAHEVATFFVYESGWQHSADKPENYEARPEAVRTIDELPTVWDETRLLSGRPGREAVFARRSGDRWFVGGIFAGPATTVRAPLGFLGPGHWVADTVRDGPSGLLRETSKVTTDGPLHVPIAANGGNACNPQRKVNRGGRRSRNAATPSA